MGDDEAARLLDSLASLRLPDTGGVAPAWWIAGGVLGLLVAVLGVRFVARGRIRRASAPARRLLEESRTELDALADRLGPADVRPDAEAVREVLARTSVLARRLALAGAPRTRVAALEGEAWLAELDALCEADAPFAAGPGALLATAPYEAAPACSRAELDGLLEAVATLARGVAASMTAVAERGHPA